MINRGTFMDNPRYTKKSIQKGEIFISLNTGMII